MRLSPILVAVLAATAAFGPSNSVRGQTVVASSSTDSVTTTPVTGSARLTEPSRRVMPSSTAFNGMGRASSLKTVAAPASLAQVQPAPVSPAEPTPAPGTPSTPQQETPDRIQITPTPAPTPSQPTIPVPPAPAPEQPVPAPAPEQPAPTQPAPTPTPEQPAPLAPAQPVPTPATPAPAPEQTTEPEPRVLVAEVLIKGVEGQSEIERRVYEVIRTQPGRTTTRSQLQEDINAVFATGFFSNVRAVPDDTPLGVRVTFEVQLNPVLQSVQVVGSQVLPEKIVTDTFSPQYGRVLNLNELQEGIKQVNKWYQDNGFVLAQIIDTPKIAADGTVTLEVAEGVVENLQVRYTDKDGNECVRDGKGGFFLRDPQGNPVVDKNGNPSRCRVRTRDFIVTREFELKPGEVFNRTKAERDLQRVFGLGIFEDVRLSLNPGQDPRKVVVVANVTEKNTGSIAAGAGISSASGLFGTLSYQQQNFGGNNQKLGAELQAGERELLFDLSFTDPWIAGDPFRTSYTVNLFRRRTISLIFDGGDPEIRLPNDDRPRVTRTGGGISFSRPLSRDVFRRAEWAASVGVQYQRVSIRDRDGELSPIDELGNDLSFSGEGRDDLFTVQLGAVRDRRDDPLRPTRGSLLRFGTEQSIPIGLGGILLNRLRASYSLYIPTRLIRFTRGCQAANPTGPECPQLFAFNIQGGTVLGDLPPYEAFSLGGSNSVRGFDDGDVGSARSFIQATAEFRFPLFSVISGALFIDAATDLGSGDNVPGNPAGVRGKPGNGIGYGAGVRIQSPLGPIRIDYGFNDQGDSRLHFGIGERF